jgi:cation diffusion facilitator family transporter
VTARLTEGPTLLTVIIAFVANATVAGAKIVAALITGSASMTAEAAHSWADTGNQVFLFIAERKSGRKRDAGHPMGYGREAYAWSMFAAFGLFTAGAVVSIMHGIQQLVSPEPDGDFAVAYLVLAVAFVLEGISFAQAFRQTRKAARSLERRRYRTRSAPSSRASCWRSSRWCSSTGTGVSSWGRASRRTLNNPWRRGSWSTL